MKKLIAFLILLGLIMVNGCGEELNADYDAWHKRSEENQQRSIKKFTICRYGGDENEWPAYLLDDLQFIKEANDLKFYRSSICGGLFVKYDNELRRPPDLLYGKLLQQEVDLGKQINMLQEKLEKIIPKSDEERLVLSEIFETQDKIYQARIEKHRLYWKRGIDLSEQEVELLKNYPKIENSLFELQKKYETRLAQKQSLETQLNTLQEKLKPLPSKDLLDILCKLNETTKQKKSISEKQSALRGLVKSLGGSMSVGRPVESPQNEAIKDLEERIEAVEQKLNE